MIRALVPAALLIFATAACGSLAPPTAPADAEMLTRSGCGVERWAVKTGSDPDVGLINTTPKAATIAALTALPAPKALPPAHRIAPVETTTYIVHAVLTGFKLEGDSDYHLVIADGAATMIAELASPTCVAPDPLKAQIIAARKQFDARYHPGLQFQHVSVPVTITGVGFWDYPHGQTGVAPNAIEIHPVTSIAFGK